MLGKTPPRMHESAPLIYIPYWGTLYLAFSYVLLGVIFTLSLFSGVQVPKFLKYLIEKEAFSSFKVIPSHLPLCETIHW